MKRLFLLALPLALAGCATMAQLPSSPAAAANATVLDEKGATGVELAATAARKAASLAIRFADASGHPLSQPAIARIGKGNRDVEVAVQATRSAYKAANATGYFAAFEQAKAAIASLLASLKE